MEHRTILYDYQYLHPELYYMTISIYIVFADRVLIST